MAITKGTPTATSGNLTTGFTLVINAGVQANDICVIGITNRDGTANPTCVDNEGAGTWTRITTVNAATNGSLSIWWKRASANTASKTITVGGCTGSASGVVMPFRGASLAASPFGTAVGEPNASGNELQAGIVTARNGSAVIHLIACTSNDTLAPGNRTATAPTTITEDGEGVSSGGSDCSMSFASDVLSTAGATGNISWAQTDGTGASLAIELLPAWTPIAADAGSVAITGTAATLKSGRIVAADGGSLAVSGTAATLRKSTPITASSGSVSITGTAAGLRAARLVTAGAGSVTNTGTAAGLFTGRRVAAGDGSVAVTGTDASITYQAGSTYTLAADPGSATLTGTAAALKVGRLASASAGSISLAGTAATLRLTRLLNATAGAQSIAGTAAALMSIRAMTAGSGSYATSGTTATLRLARSVASSTGAIVWTGTAATLTYVPNQSDFTLVADAGSVSVSGGYSEMLYINRVNRTPRHSPWSVQRTASSRAWALRRR